MMAKKEKTSKTTKEELKDQTDRAVDQELEENPDLEGEDGVDSESVENQEDKPSELEQMQAEIDEHKDKYLRLRAEFDNFKRRTIKEKIELMNSAAKDTLTGILPVLDDFDRAKKNADDDDSTEHFSEGVELVYNKLASVLSQMGLEAMESTGEDFDPEFHEAITEIPAPSEEMKGKVIDTIEKGYLLNNKIIRYAKVVVGK